MAITTIDGRMINKISTVPGAVPTVAPSFDHTDGTWTELDIYEGELFYNVADEKLFTRFGMTIMELTTAGGGGSPALSAVLAAGNSTGGTNIELTGSDEITSSTTGNVIKLDQNTDGILLSSDGTTMADKYILLSDNVPGKSGSNILLSNVAGNIRSESNRFAVNAPSNAGILSDQIYFGTNSIDSYIEVNTSNVTIYADTGTSLILDAPTTIIQQTPVTDNTNTKVLARNAVSGNLEEVDVSSIPGTTPDLATVLAAGNSTGANDIVMTLDQGVISASGNAAIQVGYTGAPDDVAIASNTGSVNLVTGPTGSDINVNTYAGDINVTSVAELHIKGSSTGVDKEINMVSGYQEVKTTNGTNSTQLQISDAQAMIHSENSTVGMELIVEPIQVYVQTALGNLLFQVNDVGVVLPEFFTPTSSADTTGVLGQFSVDDNYIYVKTSAGWKRSALAAF